jgi:hypothetical protein
MGDIVETSVYMYVSLYICKCVHLSIFSYIPLFIVDQTNLIVHHYGPVEGQEVYLTLVPTLTLKISRG